MRAQQLGADHHRHGTTSAKERHDQHEVLDSYNLVVSAELEVALPPLTYAGPVELVLVVLVPTQDPPTDGIECSHAKQEADHPSHAGHSDRHVRAPI